MAIHEIMVMPNDPNDDHIGRGIKHEAARSLGIEFDAVAAAKNYRVEGVTDKDAERLASELFTDPITESYVVSSDGTSNHGTEVAYNPGYMNPEVASILKAAADLSIDAVAADSSPIYYFDGGTREDIDRTVSGLLMNPTAEHVVKKKPETLLFDGSVGAIQEVPVRNATDAELMELSSDKLFLNIDEMREIQRHFRKLGREPKDAELEHIAGASWSEHCGHKTFKAKIFVEKADGTLVEKAPFMDRIKAAARRHPNYDRLVVSAFHDNSGVMKFYDGQALAGKVETHNSPSAVLPRAGAMTGSGGVFRDGMGTGQGAEVIISTDMHCFGPWQMDPADVKPGTLHPDYMQREVIKGVEMYGNRMNIPTGNGSVHYHEDFQAKPTVMVGAYSILPEARAQKGIPQVGDLVVTFGGRTGRDGIHGATFSSGEMTENTACVNSSAVQNGNAIEEARMSAALLEARDLGYIRAITDCGAAGFASAIGEIGSDTGVTVDMSLAPLKAPMKPWEIWISESQERMVAAIPQSSIKGLLDVCKKYNVEASVLGYFDGSNTLTVNYGEQNMIELDYDFLENGLPQRTMYAKEFSYEVGEIQSEAAKDPTELLERFKAVLAHGNVASKEPIVRQFDHGVKGGNIVGPYGGKTQHGPNDALVIRPMLDKPYGVVQSHGMNPILNRIDPYWGTLWAVAEAAANYVAVGGDINEAAAVGNYVWPFPDEESLGSLDKSVDAACDAMDALLPPVISGKDSLSSTYRGKDGEVVKIPPVYTASNFGRIPDVEKTMTSDIKKPGESRLYFIGKPSEGLGGSTYYDVTGGQSADLPKVDLEALPKTLQKVQSLIASGKVLSCHDVSEGGLITTVAEMCFGGDSGAHIQLENKKNLEKVLFAESAGCFVVEVPEGVHIYDYLGEADHELVQYIGITVKEKSFKVLQEDDSSRRFETKLETSLDELLQAWQTPLKEVFHD